MTLVVLAAGLGRRFGGDKQLAAMFPGGDTILDRTIGHAARAGFQRAVVVVRPDIADAMRAHAARWPFPADLASQPEPRGTADAVLCAGGYVDGRFAVANADDLYGTGALTALAAVRDGHAMVGYQLRHTLLGDRPVNRAICRVDDRGFLAGIDEAAITVAAGAPVGRAGDELVSMNLWGFEPTVLSHLATAVHAGTGAGTEVLLPDVVRTMLATEPVRVVPTDEHCLGVTHADDVPLLIERVGRLDRERP